MHFQAAYCRLQNCALIIGFAIVIGSAPKKKVKQNTYLLTQQQFMWVRQRNEVLVLLDTHIQKKTCQLHEEKNERKERAAMPRRQTSKKAQTAHCNSVTCVKGLYYGEAAVGTSKTALETMEMALKTEEAALAFGCTCKIVTRYEIGRAHV